MTDLVCFKAPAEEAERILKGLEEDYYKPGNPMAVGNPLYDVDGDKALFFCPVFFPVSAVKRVVEPLIIRGFKSSFSKAGIKIERVRVNKRLVARYEELQKEQESS